MLDLIQIAQLEEARLAGGLARSAPLAQPFISGGSPEVCGVMCRGEPGQWVNFAVNVGMHQEVRKHDLLALIDFYASKGIEPKLEVAPFCHESLRALLEEHGFVVRLFENVFFRDTNFVSAAAPHPLPPHITLQRLDVSHESRLHEAAILAIRGFAPPDYQPTDADISLFNRMATSERAVNFVAFHADRIVGIAAAWYGGPDNSIAMLGGAVTHPDFRRQGIQQALMAARLAELRRLNVKLATIGSKPGIATERNARRMGFQLGYTKLHMVKPGPGLAPIIT